MYTNHVTTDPEIISLQAQVDSLRDLNDEYHKNIQSSNLKITSLQSKIKWQDDQIGNIKSLMTNLNNILASKDTVIVELQDEVKKHEKTVEECKITAEVYEKKVTDSRKEFDALQHEANAKLQEHETAIDKYQQQVDNLGKKLEECQADARQKCEKGIKDCKTLCDKIIMKKSHKINELTEENSKLREQVSELCSFDEWLEKCPIGFKKRLARKANVNSSTEGDDTLPPKEWPENDIVILDEDTEPVEKQPDPPDNHPKPPQKDIDITGPTATEDQTSSNCINCGESFKSSLNFLLCGECRHWNHLFCIGTNVSI